MSALDDRILSAFLTPENVAEICDKLLRSTDPDARMIGLHIKDNLPPDYLQGTAINSRIEIAASAAPGPKDVLDSAIRLATKNGETVPPKAFRENFKNAQNWGLALLQQLFSEIRSKICGKGKTPTPLGANAAFALTTLGQAVCATLGISNHLGMGIAVLAVVNFARIGKSVLCKMTAPEELAKYFK